MEGLLERSDFFEEDAIVTSDLAVHEVANSLWVQQVLRRSITEGPRYLVEFFGLVDSTKIQLVRTGEELMREAYSISLRNKATAYDSVFVALSLQTGLPLKTLDEKQMGIFLKESRK